MTRKLFAFLAFAAIAIAVGGMACDSTVNTIDTADETDGAT